MAGPSLKKISELLQSISDDIKLPPPQPSPAARPGFFDRQIELHSEVPLPYGWEQMLDIKSGKVYYVNKITGERTEAEIFNAGDLLKAYFYLSDSSGKYVSESSLADRSSDGAADKKGKSPAAAEEEDAEPVSYLVVAGCVACHQYMMVAKGSKECPRCKGEIKLFESETCA